jgi:GT2 family glycosyltransferase
LDVSICIVNWNTKDLLFECIKSIKEKTAGVTYEIIVVDNGSNDGSVAMIKLEFPECKIIESENVGFAKGNNKAVKEASGNYILYLNPDTKLITNAVYGMFIFLDQNKTFGAVGSKLINPNGTIQYTCACTFPTPFNQMCYMFGLNRIFPTSKMFSTSELDYWDHKNSMAVDCLSGACIMVRKTIIDKLRGFDETTFMYSEDLDLCFRVIQNGWKIYYLSTEEIIHDNGSSTRKISNKNFPILLQKQSDYYFILKHFGILKAKHFKLIICIGSLFRLTVILLLAPIRMFRVANNKDILSTSISKYCNIFLWSICLRKINALADTKKHT